MRVFEEGLCGGERKVECGLRSVEEYRGGFVWGGGGMVF